MLSRNSLLCAKPENLTKVFKTKLAHKSNICQLNRFARWRLVSLRLVLKLSSRSIFSPLNPFFHMWFVCFSLPISTAFKVTAANLLVQGPTLCSESYLLKIWEECTSYSATMEEFGDSYRCDKSMNFYTTLSHIFLCASCPSKQRIL